MLPNMRLMAPKDESELRDMLYTALYMDGPVCLRYPRGAGSGAPTDLQPRALPIGKAELLTPESEIGAADVAILAYGSTVQIAIQAARELAEEDGTRVAVVNARWAKPLDDELILRLARATGALVTIEDGVVAGGFGSAVSELLHAQTDQVATTRLTRIGLPDRFVEHGPVAVLRQRSGLSADGLKTAVRELLELDDASPREAGLEAAISGGRRPRLS
jgi:1-deoxy-D-xylulose-5-phosphate synthase